MSFLQIQRGLEPSWFSSGRGIVELLRTLLRHQLEGEGVEFSLETKRGQGLTQAEALHRLAKYGPNELIERGLVSAWRILWEQLTAVMVVILIIAAIISLLLAD